MTVTVVIPVYRDHLAVEEREAIRRVTHILGKHDCIAVMPDTMRKPPFEAGAVTFHRAFFESPASYSKLLLSDEFYARFERYDYILVHQLDALVFRDELDAWCARGFDYIGAPLHLDKQNPASKAVVGNGGFSLRRVEGFRRVLASERGGKRDGTSFVRDVVRVDIPDAPLRGPMSLIERVRILRSVRTGVEVYTRGYSLNEDLFWSLRARLFFPAFKTPPVREAAEFAMENFPRRWYETVGGKIPFGCHAWAKWDRQFWEEVDPVLKGIRQQAESVE